MEPSPPFPKAGEEGKRLRLLPYSTVTFRFSGE
jgi:hypothetical protein